MSGTNNSLCTESRVLSGLYAPCCLIPILCKEVRKGSKLKNQEKTNRCILGVDQVYTNIHISIIRIVTDLVATTT